MRTFSQRATGPAKVYGHVPIGVSWTVRVIHWTRLHVDALVRMGSGLHFEADVRGA
jgi:hypothetical protein